MVGSRVVPVLVKLHPELLVALGCVLVIDLVTLYSVVPYLALKQGMWQLAGLFVSWGVLLVPYTLFVRNSRLIYAAVVLLLGVVFLAGHVSHGARRWIGVGSIQIQPSEFMILALVLLLTWLMCHEGPQSFLGMKAFLQGVAVTALPAFLIARQPDLGTAFELIIILAVFIFLKGIPSRIISISLLGAIAFFPVVWEMVWNHLHEFQKNRIRAFIDPSSDPSGLGYHTIQSIVAVGSGGWTGQGFAGATQVRYRFLPGAHTDFVFAVYTEEWGFLGALLFLGLMAYLVWFGFRTALECRDQSGFFLAAGLTGFLLFGFLINALMVLGILPVVGVPMPLLSYGGSAMIVSLVSLAFLVNIRMYSKR